MNMRQKFAKMTSRQLIEVMMARVDVVPSQERKRRDA